MSRRNIALIGLPGAGKTTVGRLLAEAFGWGFYDCDAAFESEAGARIADWVAANGWAAFRERERALLTCALARKKIVIATGGGAVEDEESRAALAAFATVVWLDAPPAVLTDRVGSAHGRPLLAGNPGGRLAELAERRLPLYGALADVRIDAAGSDPAQVTACIMHELDSLE